MNNNPKPIDQPLDNRKANIIEQVPALHKQYKEKRGAIRHDPEPDSHGKPEAQAALKNAYGKIAVEHGYDSVHDPVKSATFLDKEAARKKADITSGPEDRFPIKSVFAGGYDIQCPHVRILVHKPK